MLKQWIVGFCSAAVLVACGGGQPAADNAGDATDTEGSDVPTDETAGGTETDKPPPGGIVRDADGDGVPDDKEVSSCADKSEKQCKINMECAWSEEGKCVKAKAGM